jgi:hypothetical protein
MCAQGHNICNNCRSHISPVADCTADPSEIRNVALEDILETAIYPCPFAVLAQVPCRWSGILFEIDSHVRDRDKHANHYVEGTGESEWIPLSIPLAPRCHTAIFALEELFFLVCTGDDECFKFSVFHVGHKNDSSGFAYEFKIQCPKICETTWTVSYGECHNYRQDRNEVYEPMKFVRWPTDLIKMYSTYNNHMSCAIKIIRRAVIGYNHPTEPMPAYTADSSHYVCDVS